MKKVVAIGGGTGLSTLLRGLKKYDYDITAIVTMTDDGSSTGRLRRDLDVLPPGDIRKCIAALSENETALLDLFTYRFKRGFGLSGHSLGNLLLSAMFDMTGDYNTAVEKMCELLKTKGKVLPATLKNVHIGAEFVDGKKVFGESNITRYGYKNIISRVFLNKEASTNPKATSVLKGADLIIIGPGSLYTSIIPNFLHQDLLNSYQNSKAKKVYICNVSTERGETENYTARDHIKEIEKYCIYYDVALFNNRFFPEHSGDGFVYPVKIDVSGSKVILGDIIQEENPLFHDSEKLSKKIVEISRV